MAKSARAGGPSKVQDIAESWTRMRPDLVPSHYLLPIYLRRIALIVDRLDERVCRQDFGVSSSELRVLFALRRQGEPFCRRPTDLFRALLVTSGAITKQVARLVKAGMVRRLPDPSNAGGFLIQLTDKGRETADRALDYVATQSILSPQHSTLTSKERLTLQKLCEKVLTDMEASLGEDDFA